MLVKCFESLKALYKFPIIIIIVYMQQKYFSSSNVSSLGPGHIGLLFTNEEQKKVGSWCIFIKHTSAIHATLRSSELRSCVKVEVAILESPSLISLMVSVDVKNHETGRHVSLVHDVTQTAWHQTVVFRATSLWPWNTNSYQTRPSNTNYL